MQSDEHAVLERLNASLGGFNQAMGLQFVAAGPERVVAEFEVGDQHRMPYGIVHGGVHAGMIEAVTSVGAALHSFPRGQAVVGLENSTSFLRAVRSGRLRVTATPVSTGRKSQVWRGRVEDAQGRAIAEGRVRLLCVPGDAKLAGEPVEVREDT